MRRVLCALFVPALIAGLVSCDATVELTKAPFNATTDISDGFTNATSDITQPLREFTSSTTPGSWFGNNPAKTRQKVEVFSAWAYENIRSDVSRGGGEYLTALATLAGVPIHQLAGFKIQMQQHYASLYEERLTLRESAARVVNTAWSAGHGQPARVVKEGSTDSR